MSVVTPVPLQICQVEMPAMGALQWPRVSTWHRRDDQRRSEVEAQIDFFFFFKSLDTFVFVKAD